MADREKIIKLLIKCGVWGANKTTGEIADFLIANGVTFATDTNDGGKWISVEDDKPDEFVSVLGHMTDAGDFPAVRECYRVGGVFFFPALMDRHPVDKWMEMPREE